MAFRWWIGPMIGRKTPTRAKACDSRRGISACRDTTRRAIWPSATFAWRTCPSSRELASGTSSSRTLFCELEEAFSSKKCPGRRRPGHKLWKVLMPERILSISGLRGIVGDGLDPEYVTHFAAALGTMFDGGLVVLSRDGRGSGETLRYAVLAGLLGTGCRVVDLGIASTPTCGVLVQALGAAGGLQLTASHNPIEWNGL